MKNSVIICFYCLIPGWLLSQNNEYPFIDKNISLASIKIFESNDTLDKSQFKLKKIVEFNNRQIIHQSEYINNSKFLDIYFEYQNNVLVRKQTFNKDSVKIYEIYYNIDSLNNYINSYEMIGNNPIINLIYHNEYKDGKLKTIRVFQKNKLLRYTIINYNSNGNKVDEMTFNNENEIIYGFEYVYDIKKKLIQVKNYENNRALKSQSFYYYEGVYLVKIENLNGQGQTYSVTNYLYSQNRLNEIDFYEDERLKYTRKFLYQDKIIIEAVESDEFGDLFYKYVLSEN